MNTSFLSLTAATASDAGMVGGTDSRAIIVGLLTGIAFGAILQRVGASSFHKIVNMLRLKDLTIMKFLFLAIAVGSMGMYAVNQWAPDSAHINIAPVYLLGIGIGGLIFGVGWALAGYCPGTVLVALGQGKVDAIFTILGGLAGAITLSLVWSPLEDALVKPLNYGSESLPELLGLPSLPVAIALAALIIAFIYFLTRLEKGGGESSASG